MNASVNSFGQPIRMPVPGWAPRPLPPKSTMVGRYCRVEPLDIICHAAQLHEANQDDVGGRNWTYLTAEPPADFSSYRAWLSEKARSQDPLFHAIVDGQSGKAVGLAAYLRIDAANGVMEIGHLNFAPALQRTRAATEAMYLMMRRAFDELGYRRYEWKCDSLNAQSQTAARRFGFRYEGLFRQAIVYKGRNRDTAWYSIVDSEWPARKEAFERWLDPSNFDGQGQQKTSLSALTSNG